MENQKISLPPPSPTAYDDSFRTMLNDCTGLIIPVVNLYFNENYTGNEEITFGKNEHYLAHSDSTEDKRVTDSSFTITRADRTKKRYHIECEEQLDGSILIRMFEYDAQLALDDHTINGAELTVSFPHSAVMALRYANSAPDTMKINVVTPGGQVSYTVPIIKVQQYRLDELFEKKLLFFLPFYIFRLEKELPECDADEAKLEQLKAMYRNIRSKLDDLQRAGEIDDFVKNAICSMSNHVMALIAQKYENVRRGVEHIMGGKIIEYEAKTILNKGIEQGIEQGIKQGIKQGIEQGIEQGVKQGIEQGIEQGVEKGRGEERQKALAETEERAKDMIRDRMDLSLVEKYTHLSLTRIKELAHGLGML